MSSSSKTYTALLVWRVKTKEGRNCSINDALNTFYLGLYSVIHMVKDHSDSERENPLPTLGRLFPISSKVVFFYMRHPTHKITHTTAFVTSVVEHWLEREIGWRRRQHLQLEKKLTFSISIVSSLISAVSLFFVFSRLLHRARSVSFSLSSSAILALSLRLKDERIHCVHIYV